MKTYKDFKGYKNVAAMKADGFSDADIENLKSAPRTREAEGDKDNGSFFKWPCINGCSTTGLYSVLNESERVLYRAYYNRTHSGTSSNGSRTQAAKIDISKDIEDIQSLIKNLEELKAPQELITKTISRLPAFTTIKAALEATLNRFIDKEPEEVEDIIINLVSLVIKSATPKKEDK